MAANGSRVCEVPAGHFGESKDNWGRVFNLKFQLLAANYSLFDFTTNFIKSHEKK